MHIFSKAWVCIKPSLCLSIGRPEWEWHGINAEVWAKQIKSKYVKYKTYKASSSAAYITVFFDKLSYQTYDEYSRDFSVIFYII